jgi:hypothetical protein
MNAHRPEVADVIRSYGDQFLAKFGDSTSEGQRRVMKDLAACRTAALGGHKLVCDECGHEEISYNSCRNRHCPKCQAMARAQWLDAQRADLLEVEYFHVVFTLPDLFGHIALQNKRAVYDLLFQAASETLLTIARDTRHLGADIGILAVLHTWGQNLDIHPHIHCVVPGGGLSLDGKRWLSCPKGFFLPVRVLSRLFRGKFLDYLDRSVAKKAIRFHGKLTRLAKANEWKRLLQEARRQEWVVYAKPPFGGAEQVLKYLARYTHRVAVSNQRLIAIENGRVTFHWKDYSDHNRQKMMTLDAVEFLRRFLLHLLPNGFQRIRHYGFLANRVRREKLALCRKLLHMTVAGTESTDQAQHTEPQQKDSPHLCPVCKKGNLVSIDILPPIRTPLTQFKPVPMDTS